jgi:uncharacterized protein (DUF2237 family)
MPADTAPPPERNVLGTALEPCNPGLRAGYFRTGRCSTDASDRGVHTVCAEVTDAFLAYSRGRGNDLVTPRPEFDFPGLRAGDAWCLCVDRWLEAEAAGVAPPVRLEATHERTLVKAPLDRLRNPRKNP